MRRKVQVIVLGGTITMVPKKTSGIAPGISGAELISAIPDLSRIADIDVTTPFLVPSASHSFAQMQHVSDLIEEAIRGGAAGVVIAQGTDTIDETGFLFDLVHRHSEPVVITGAMRGAAAPGADGHANLLAAVTVAASPEAQDLGVLVVLNDEIHAARFVAKAHTSLPSAFVSPGFGPIGHVIEGRARIPLRSTRIDLGFNVPMTPPASVGIVSIGFDDDGRMIDAATKAGFDGLVVEAMGAGHIPAGLVAGCEKAAESIPVLLSTRVPGGPVFSGTYGFPGSEIDLLGRGLISAGYLSAHKARLLLALLLGAGRNRQDISSAFSRFQ